MSNGTPGMSSECMRMLPADAEDVVGVDRGVAQEREDVVFVGGRNAW